MKTVKKKQKHKSKGNVRTITKQVKNDSFFNFFDPPPIPDDPNADIDPETQDLLTADFEIGHYIRDRIIPRAVLFFTGKFLVYFGLFIINYFLNFSINGNSSEIIEITFFEKYLAFWRKNMMIYNADGRTEFSLM